jgi:hypothetical protein
MFKDEILNLELFAEKHNLDKIKMTHRLMDGRFNFNINKAIKEDKIDYVVMGTEGASGWSAFFPGLIRVLLFQMLKCHFCVFRLKQNSKNKTIGFTTRFRAKDKSF